MQSVFFALAPEREANEPSYKSSVINLLGSRFNIDLAFLSDAPRDGTLEWINGKLETSAIACFDVTTRHPDVLIALGIAQDSDTEAFCFFDPNVASDLQETQLMRNLARYNGADDFQRKVDPILVRVLGQDQARMIHLQAKVKRHLGRLQPLSMRQLARELGLPADEIRMPVYRLHQGGELIKEGYGRWTKYRLATTGEGALS